MGEQQAERLDCRSIAWIEAGADFNNEQKEALAFDVALVEFAAKSANA